MIGTRKARKLGPVIPAGIPASLLTKQRVASYLKYATNNRALSCDIHTPRRQSFRRRVRASSRISGCLQKAQRTRGRPTGVLS
jgi:hypothetical protein